MFFIIMILFRFHVKLNALYYTAYNLNYKILSNNKLYSMLLNILSVGFKINLLWVSSHTGILGNKITNALATSCYNNIPSSIKIFYFNFTPYLKAHTLKLWNEK